MKNWLFIPVTIFGLFFCVSCKKDKSDTMADRFRNKIGEDTYSYGIKSPGPYSISFENNDSLIFDFVAGIHAGKYELALGDRKTMVNINDGRLKFEAILSDKDTLNASLNNNYGYTFVTGRENKGFFIRQYFQ
jgi:hypothetical protein